MSRLNISSSLKGVGGDRAELRYATTLGVEPFDGRVRGLVTVNQLRSLETDNAGPRTHRLQVPRGTVRIEANLPAPIDEEGSWSFDFADTHELDPGSLRVESGDVISISPSTVIFRLRPGAATPIRFTLETR